jgi:hypothetical protein
MLQGAETVNTEEKGEKLLRWKAKLIIHKVSGNPLQKLLGPVRCVAELRQGRWEFVSVQEKID